MSKSTTLCYNALLDIGNTIIIKHYVNPFMYSVQTDIKPRKQLYKLVKTSFYPDLLADRVKLRSEDNSFDVIDFGVPG